MRLSTAAVWLSILALSASTSAGAFPRAHGSQNQTAAAGKQTSSGAGPLRDTSASRVSQSSLTKDPVKVKWEKGKLTLDAESAALSDVLLAISSATGIDITGEKQLTERVSVHLAEAELWQALHELLFHVDYAITVGPRGSPSPVETQLIVLGKSLSAVRPADLTATSQTNVLPTEQETPTASNSTSQADTDPQARSLSSGQAAETGQQQLSSQPTVADQQSVAPAATDAPQDSSATAGIFQPPSQDDDSAALALVAAAATNQDRTALEQYMQNTNAAVQAAAFNAFASLDNSAAVQDLLGMINDGSQPNQLQSLQLLSQSPQIDEQIVTSTLINALNGPDPTLSSNAAQALASLGTPEAMNALNQMFNSSNASTQLMILQSVGQTQAGQDLLRMALSESNESVSSAAATMLAQFESLLQQAGTTTNQ
jgi:hypothetical protein